MKSAIGIQICPLPREPPSNYLPFSIEITTVHTVALKALRVWPYFMFLTSSPLLQLPQYRIALFFFFFPFLEHILIQVSKRVTPFLFLIFA